MLLWDYLLLNSLHESSYSVCLVTHFVLNSFLRENLAKSANMSRSAGTLITTNQATYIPPRFMPGYHGHVPTLKFSYAQTYGNATAQYMQDYRSKTLEESKNQYWAGGYFPTIYSHKPDLVIGNRTRSRDRWLTEPRYRLNVRDHDRQENLIHLDKLASAKRDHYLDKSGTVPKVEYFQIPVPAEQQFRRHVP
ncbi:DgyrCDS1004 [Dimorphilus gyrociliatus]|nr:DgyrCDS1004 [Dimorphilus gyrociliatus]